jgi:hypothetical protein
MSSSPASRGRRRTSRRASASSARPSRRSTAPPSKPPPPPRRVPRPRRSSAPRPANSPRSVTSCAPQSMVRQKPLAAPPAHPPSFLPMTRFGKTAQTAISALSLLAEVYDGGRTKLSSSEIARRRRLPRPIVAKILTLVSSLDLVDGTQGPGGGYWLKRRPRRSPSSTLCRSLIPSTGRSSVPSVRAGVDAANPARCMRRLKSWTPTGTATCARPPWRCSPCPRPKPPARRRA